MVIIMLMETKYQEIRCVLWQVETSQEKRQQLPSTLCDSIRMLFVPPSAFLAN